MSDFKPWISVGNDYDFADNQTELGFTDTFGEGISSGFKSTSLGLIGQWSPYLSGYGTKVTRDQFDALYGGYGLEYDPHMSRQEYRATLDANRDRREEDQMMSRASVGGTLGFIGGNIVGGIPDPLNLIGAGEAATVARLGRAVIKAGAINLALDAPLTAAEYALRQKQQDPMSAGDVAFNSSLAFGLGGLFGAAGYGVARWAERARGLHLGMGLDDEGRLINVDDVPDDLPEPITEPLNTAIARGDRVEADLRAAEAPTEADLEANPHLREERRFQDELLKRETKFREETMRDGSKVIYDAETGEIVSEVAPVRSEVSPENQKLADELRGELKKLRERNPMKTKNTKRGPIQEETIPRADFERIVDDRLEAEGYKRTNPERAKERDEVPGVLVARVSKGNRGTLKEINLRDWWRLQLSNRTIKRRAMHEIAGPNTRYDRVLNRLRVLNRRQFDYLMDHVAQMPALKQMVRAGGIDIPPSANRREIGDSIWAHIRGKDMWNIRTPKTPTKISVRAPEIDIPEVIEGLNAETLTENMKKAWGSDDPDTQIDIEALGEEIPTDDLDKYLRAQTEEFDLDALAERSPEVRELIARAEQYKVKKGALIDFMVCMLGPSE